ncbi:uncharacterized protein LOC117333778 [Pecten maximus]|uniref:uncharacterized protein LOC117333778 n=1 Tax=Pecten maximus TaxID=6579 RepID=UPI001458BCB3|nr:uncharacterized protein LOC117333778 [Pecten maximus]
MAVYTFVFLVTCFLFVHGRSSDVTDHVTPDITTVLLLVSDLKQQIEELKTQRLNDRHIISSLELKVNSIQVNYENISGENNKLRDRIKTLESIHRDDYHQDTSSLEVVPLEDGASQYRRKLEMDDADDHFNQTFTPSDLLVAFSAYLSHTINELVADYSIKFDHVITNVGNGYNPTTGVFTCPKSGTYVLTWSIGMLHPGYIYTYLTRNGGSISFANTADDTYSSMASQTVVYVLNQGDVITVKVVSHTASPGLWYGRTSFSGFILH